MSKLLFKPVSIVSGILAGLIGTRLFRGVWRLIDKERPPKPEERPASAGKLIAALLLEGALFRLVRGLAEHGSRQAFSNLTGIWPGEARAKSDRAAKT
jgi:Protein of unknown function (DUF4235)